MTTQELHAAITHHYTEDAALSWIEPCQRPAALLTDAGFFVACQWPERPDGRNGLHLYTEPIGAAIDCRRCRPALYAHGLTHRSEPWHLRPDQAELLGLRPLGPGPLALIFVLDALTDHLENIDDPDAAHYRRLMLTT